MSLTFCFEVCVVRVVASCMTSLNLKLVVRLLQTFNIIAPFPLCFSNHFFYFYQSFFLFCLSLFFFFFLFGVSSVFLSLPVSVMSLFSFRVMSLSFHFVDFDPVCLCPGFCLRVYYHRLGSLSKRFFTFCFSVCLYLSLLFVHVRICLFCICLHFCPYLYVFRAAWVDDLTDLEMPKEVHV